MYAVIKEEKAWDIIKDRFLWRKNLPVSDKITELIKEDLEIIRAVKDA